MAAERVALLFMAMDADDQLRRRLVAGEFTVEEAGGLTESERQLLSDAATEELPDVTGYTFGAPKVEISAPGRYATINYIGQNLSDPSIQASFLNFQNTSALEMGA
jgi:hypothetical protein